MQIIEKYSRTLKISYKFKAGKGLEVHAQGPPERIESFSDALRDPINAANELKKKKK